MEIICYACGRGELPENTLEAIEHCQSVNANWRIEMDINMTADGEIILFHDQNTFRVTGKNNQVKNTRYEDLLLLDVGHTFFRGQNKKSTTFRIPTLREVFEKYDTGQFVLDVHTEDLRCVPRIIQIVEHFRRQDSIVVVSKYDSVIESFKKIKPRWVYGAPSREAKRLVFSSFVFADRFYPIRSDILMLPYYSGKVKVLTRRVLNHVRRRGKQIWVWWFEGKTEAKTVDRQEEVTHMKNLGVDGIFTSCPERISR